ncbi:MAG: YihY/virulence factor BrkB family protein [Campylobacterales bacterium]|nr:YihY/virulence factor BrkB family protein [Campylobacterales bacterium]
MLRKLLQLYRFFSDETPYYAASLSFFTIFSLLPLLALLISVVSTMPTFATYLDLLMVHIMDFINPTHSQSLAKNIQSFLVNTKELGSIGVFYLLFVFTMFFRDYEHVVNRIFGSQSRSIVKMFFMYLVLMLLIPILFALFIFVSTLSFLQFSFSVHIFTFLFIWSMFVIIFMISPNTKVSFKAAVIGSLLTVISLSFVKKMFGIYVISNTTYSTIYGSFSIALFFFLWIYISWSIYLYGIKLSALINNYGNRYENK